MQFLPRTFAAYVRAAISIRRRQHMVGGAATSPQQFRNDRDHALYQYNHANPYVRPSISTSTLIGATPGVRRYYRWDVYCRTTAGDVLLPIGYAQVSPIPAATESRHTRSK